MRTNIDAVRTAAQVLDQFEVLWRTRLHRFGEVLADPSLSATTDQGATP